MVIIYSNYVIEQTNVLLNRQLNAPIIGGSGASLEASANTSIVEGATLITGAVRDAAIASVPGTPSVTPPSAPTSVAATAGAKQATVTWTAPSSGGSITLYTVTSSPGARTATSTTTSATVTGLSNNTAYTFTVTATNAAGTSPSSSPSSAVTTANVPGFPTGVSGVAGDTQVTVSFTAPSSDGGSPITSYTASSSSGRTATGPSSPLTVTGLQNGNPYTFTVTATNAAGTSTSSSPSASVTPTWPNGSVIFNGTSSFASWNGATAGAVSFTVECFIYISDFSSRNVVLGATYAGPAVNTQLVISVTSSTTITVERMNGTSNAFTVPTMSTNTWYHLAYVRGTGDTATVFLAGTRSSTGTVTDSTSYSYPSGLIGVYRPLSNLANAGYFKGNISNFRWVFSQVYNPTSSTITVPTTNLTNITNTQLLLNTLYSSAQDNSVYLRDTSSVPQTMTAVNLTSTTVNPF